MAMRPTLTMSATVSLRSSLYRPSSPKIARLNDPRKKASMP